MRERGAHINRSGDTLRSTERGRDTAPASARRQGRSTASRSLRTRAARTALVIGLAIGFVPAALGSDFEQQLKRVDHALRNNPSRVNELALESCRNQRNRAARLYDERFVARAERRLAYCFQILEVPEALPQTPEEDAALAIARVQAKAAQELEQALLRPPDVARGLEIYRGCADCHMPEGWGLTSGIVPQLAGQHRRVVIKQLADIRAGHRQAVVMAPYASVDVIGGVQAVADVAGYIDTLEISTGGGKGPGDQLALGEQLYGENCARCHGAAGEGDGEAFVPRIQSQHFAYLMREFQAILDGRRRNANAEMREQIEGFSESEARAVLDWVSRLEPPIELQAPPGWRNPDFAKAQSAK